MTVTSKSTNFLPGRPDSRQDQLLPARLNVGERKTDLGQRKIAKGRRRLGQNTAITSDNFNPTHSSTPQKCNKQSASKFNSISPIKKVRFNLENVSQEK